MISIINIDEHTDVYGIKWKGKVDYPGLEEFLEKDAPICSGSWATFFEKYYNIKKTDNYWVIKVFSYGKLKSIIRSKGLLDLEGIILSTKDFVLSIDMDVLNVEAIKKILGYIPAYFEFGKMTLGELQFLVNAIIDISKPRYISIFGLSSFKEIERIINILVPEYRNEKIERISEDVGEKIYSKAGFLKVLGQRLPSRSFIYFSYPHVDILFIPTIRNYVRNLILKFLCMKDNFSLGGFYGIPCKNK